MSFIVGYPHALRLSERQEKRPAGVLHLPKVETAIPAERRLLYQKTDFPDMRPNKMTKNEDGLVRRKTFAPKGI